MAFSVGNIRPSVNQLRRLGNWSQMFRWGIVIDTFPKLLTGYNSQDINIRALSATVPEKSGETTEIAIRGSKVRQPGIYSYTSPWSCTLMETNDVLVQRFLTEWKNLCWQSANGSTGITQNHADLEALVSLYQLNNKDEAIYRYQLVGCFPETDSRGDFDGSNGEAMQPNLSLAFDYFKEEASSNGTQEPYFESANF